MSHSRSPVRVTRTLDAPLGVASAAPSAAGILLLHYPADPPPFVTAADFYVTPKRKCLAQKDHNTTQMPLDCYEKMGDASSEPIGRIANFYRMDQVIDEEPSDKDSGNGFRHEVPGLRVAARLGAARFQKN